MHLKGIPFNLIVLFALAFHVLPARGNDLQWEALWTPPNGEAALDGTIDDVVAGRPGGSVFASVKRLYYGGKEWLFWIGYVAKFSGGRRTLEVSPAHPINYQVIGTDSLEYLYLMAQYDGTFKGSPFGSIAKYQSSSVPVWEIAYSAGPSDSWPEDMLVELDGSFYSAGIGLEIKQFTFSPIIRKHTPDGKLVWEKWLARDSTMAVGLEKDRSGNVAMHQENEIAVFDGNGNLVRSFTTIGNISGRRMAFGNSDEVYLGTDSSNVVRRHNADGSLAWQRSFPSLVEAVECDGNRVFVVTRTSAHALDPNGMFLWNDLLITSTAPHSASLDGIGNLWVARPGSKSLARFKANSGLTALDASTAEADVAAGYDSDYFHLEQIAFNGPVRVSRYRCGIDHDTAELVRGTATEHNDFAMYHSDDGYWGIAPGPVFTTSQDPISIILTHHAPQSSPMVLGFVLESRGTASGVRQSVQVYNFASASWTTLESEASLPFGGAPDRYMTWEIPSPAEHIGPGREIRVRLEYRNNAPVFVWPWKARIDREFVYYDI